MRMRVGMRMREGREGESFSCLPVRMVRWGGKRDEHFHVHKPRRRLFEISGGTVWTQRFSVGMVHTSPPRHDGGAVILLPAQHGREVGKGELSYGTRAHADSAVA